MKVHWLTVFLVTILFKSSWSLTPLRAPLLRRYNNLYSGSYNQALNTGTPPRNDVCKVLISGVVGTEPKEIYLKNGHYVINFALAVVGHFKAIHNQEFHKPAETMWLSVEMWDSFAKENYANIKKGVAIQAVGYIILNKWIDKMNGEERKMYKTRVTKLLTKEECTSMQAIMGDITGDDRSSSGQPIQSDSGFASEAPDIDDQSEFVLDSSDRDTFSPGSHSGKTGYICGSPPWQPRHAEVEVGAHPTAAPHTGSPHTTQSVELYATDPKVAADSSTEDRYHPWWA